MNTLNIIKKQIQKASDLHNAQIHLTRYRGTECKVHEGGDTVHGTFCYRGKAYSKYRPTFRVSGPPNSGSFFMFSYL